MEGKFEGMERAFNPRSVVVIGDKMQNNNYSFLRSLSTFQGRVSSVNIDPQEFSGIEALGIKNYTSLLDVPDPIDYAIVAVPREIAPIILRDCIEKKVGGVSLFTSGFAETRTSEGMELADTITRMARDAGLNLIGPNCMGIFNPRIGLRHSPDQYTGDGGSVGFISQSGGHAINFSIVGFNNGIRISKLVSYGNGYVLDSTDYCEYLLRDKETKIIALYIEGIRDGRRFFNLLKEATREKPILIWKGGQTEEGSRATASHSGSMAESNLMWETALKQSGAIKIDSLEQLVDTVMMLLYSPSVKKNGVGLISLSGGQCVNMTDAFAKRGLKAPLLTEKSYKELSSILALVGASYRNPVDLGGNLSLAESTRRALLRRDDVPPRERLLDITLDILDRDENIDSIVIEMSAHLMEWFKETFVDFAEYFYSTLAHFRKKSEKPVIVIIPPSKVETGAIEMKRNLLEIGVASFPSFSRGAEALGKVLEYYRHRL
ncbi:MAG: CoA-binding protein [Pseudomonadota bacterium]